MSTPPFAWLRFYTAAATVAAIHTKQKAAPEGGPEQLTRNRSLWPRPWLLWLVRRTNRPAVADLDPDFSSVALAVLIVNTVCG